MHQGRFIGHLNLVGDGTYVEFRGDRRDATNRHNNGILLAGLEAICREGSLVGAGLKLSDAVFAGGVRLDGTGSPSIRRNHGDDRVREKSSVSIRDCTGNSAVGGRLGKRTAKRKGSEAQKYEENRVQCTLTGFG